jgi:hypothetical protein
VGVVLSEEIQKECNWVWKIDLVELLWYTAADILLVESRIIVPKVTCSEGEERCLHLR